jgi:hypothetical protein
MAEEIENEEVEYEVKKTKKSKCKCKKQTKKVRKSKIIPTFATSQPYNPNAITYFNGGPSSSIPFSSANVPSNNNKTNKAEYQLESIINPPESKTNAPAPPKVIKKLNGRKSRKQNPDEFEKEFNKATVKELKEQCKKWGIPTKGLTLKEHYVSAAIKHFKDKGASEEKQKGKNPLIQEPNEATPVPVVQQIEYLKPTTIKKIKINKKEINKKEINKKEIKKAYNVPYLKTLCKENSIKLKPGTKKGAIIELLKKQGIQYYEDDSGEDDKVEIIVEKHSNLSNETQQNEEIDNEDFPYVPTTLFQQDPNELNTPGFHNAESPSDMPFPGIDSFYSPKSAVKDY